MTYQIALGENLSHELVAIVDDQAGKARNALLGGIADRDEAIHEARKRFKKLRGLYRLVRPAAPDLYATENARLRDSAHALSVVRDAAALVETLDRLRADPLSQSVRDDLDRVRETLARRRDAIADDGGQLDPAIAEAVESCEATMKAARQVRLPSGKKAAAQCLSAGMGKTFKRARKAFGAARESGKPEDWHELRKRMKYHHMHCRLLRQAWPAMMMMRSTQAKAIADLLGDDHDLAVLEGLVRVEPDAVGDADARESLIHVMHLSSERLRAAAVERAALVLSDKPATVEDAVAALCRQAA
ncbi:MULTISPECIES: CHAD domain-containing protein [unclassified Roseitalea]|uniref:CHAD domain-containing protein n=1 Tax=unclassified Roseitalea TaxID=2639107 RepID=UPI00273ED500|nr:MULTISPECIES: CHAD domain-containing protein [unclassified Roseitalea]